MKQEHPWQLLEQELALWQQSGSRLSLWWRDDDATSDTPALEQLLNLSNRHQVPLSLAVIPKGLQPSLASRLKGYTKISCLLHGYDHSNYAPPEQRKQELGLHRPKQQVINSLVQGHQKLSKELGTAYHPVLVPPWNRISKALIDELSAVGLLGLSTLGPRNDQTDLTVNNVHIDLIDWKQRCFAGEQRVLNQLVTHLRQRRLRQVDPLETTGIMSHHLAHDTQCWEFLHQLLALLQSHPCVRWPSIDCLFPDKHREA
ncbi:polysaccharide deacetylase family protein [Aestuariirhabdus sp. Z084]|uniref:polysaccharide deacetylase family protein n=1 Tax=Aestuariirhabdus haliotis TaxID=2918751 RepID=UPI00201B3768|nr:polysaccharide deacetylase family protein [Aestuariirhabdus haliotis]MCL6414837.1 polysaccharide deacetylase family protein [Aestuariirhabdus haliotis]MCL6418769.1 polysaccharide deacetylase family protein [Aestuariirhabdus haliotis]